MSLARYWKTDPRDRAVHYNGGEVALVAAVAAVFVAIGIWAILRPVQAFRVFYIWSDEPPTKFDIGFMRLMGVVFTAGPIAIGLGVLWQMISN